MYFKNKCAFWILLSVTTILFSASLASSLPCNEGAITGSCECGIATYTSGYCCRGVWFDPYYSDTYANVCSQRFLYVNNSHLGCSDATSRAANTQATPWCTFLRAVRGNSDGNRNSAGVPGEAAQAGDVVLVAPGIYDYTGPTYDRSDSWLGVFYGPVNSGSSGAWITFHALGKVELRGNLGGRAHFIGTDAVAGSRYIKFKGFTINQSYVGNPGEAGGVACITSDHVRFEDNTLIGHVSTGADNHWGIIVHGPRSGDCTGYVRDVHIRNNRISGFTGNGGRNEAGIILYCADDLVIEHNELYNNGNGIYAKSSYTPSALTPATTIRFNTFRDNAGFGIGSQAWSNWHVYQNLFLRNGLGVAMFNFQYFVGGAQPRNYRVANNVLYGNNVAFDLEGTCDRAIDMVYRNNVAYNSASLSITGSYDGAMTCHAGLFDKSNYDFDNNMYGQAGNFGEFFYVRTAFPTWQSASFDYQDTNSTSGVDPLFVDAANDNYRLQQSSPARTLGVDILDLDRDGSTTDTIPAGAYITGNEVIGRTTQSQTTLIDVNLDSAPTSENNGGVYTGDAGTVVLDTRNGIPTNMFDHVTGSECWGGTGGCAKFYGSTSGGGAYRGFNLGSYSGATTQLNLRYLTKWNSLWRGASNLKGNYLSGPKWTQEKGMAFALGGFQMALSYQGTLYYTHGNRQSQATCDRDGYQCCEYMQHCSLGPNVRDAGPFYFQDYDNQWVAVEIEQISIGTVRLYLWTQDRVFNGLYMEARNANPGTPGVTGFGGMYFHDSGAASGSYVMVDEIKASDFFIGPPEGFFDSTDTTPPSQVTGLTAIAVSQTQINLTWNAATDTSGSGLAGYIIYQNGINTANTTLTRYANTELTPSTTYTYTVAAYDAAGNIGQQSTSASATTQSSSHPLLLFDDFEYVVNRDNSPLPGPTGSAFVTEGPWSNVKAVNINGGHVGYLYTKTSIPGYTGNFPGRNSSRVLFMESPNVAGGSDFYLQYGGSVDNTIPANVWFQWWMYINHYGNELSGLENRHKFIYPCAGGYPCSIDNLKWLVSLSSSSYNTLNSDPFGSPTVNGEAFVVIRDQNGPNYSPAYPDNHWKLGPNLQPEEQAYIVPNQWQLIKINLDTSVENSGKFQVWIKPLGGQWRKVSEWIAGVTPNFTWTHSAGGHRGFRMPTTIGWSNTTGGAYYYMDDFAMATSEAALPNYGSIPPPTNIPGDVNNDGFVNLADLQLVVNTFGRSAGQSGFDSRCDLAAPIGTINLFDVMVVVRNWG